mmetsp:Transcript_50463/g.109391  ORF Transcript_50463/g.109391 Transcript_50463/m.109391 type:complete len:265 (-) Transcript_50463:2515-3309(-)
MEAAPTHWRRVRAQARPAADLGPRRRHRHGGGDAHAECGGWLARLSRQRLGAYDRRTPEQGHRGHAIWSVEAHAQRQGRHKPRAQRRHRRCPGPAERELYACRRRDHDPLHLPARVVPAVHACERGARLAHLRARPEGEPRGSLQLPRPQPWPSAGAQLRRARCVVFAAAAVAARERQFEPSNLEQATADGDCARRPYGNGDADAERDGAVARLRRLALGSHGSARGFASRRGHADGGAQASIARQRPHLRLAIDRGRAQPGSH